jgi:hypothetical protein
MGLAVVEAVAPKALKAIAELPREAATAAMALLVLLAAPALLMLAAAVDQLMTIQVLRESVALVAAAMLLRLAAGQTER